MDKLNLHTPNLVDKNIQAIAALFPNALTEVMRDGKTEYAIDFDVLRQELSNVVVEGAEERYQFTWPDKKQSVLRANAPNYKTLRPCREESVNFDTTENLYIEGDNLDVLKLLQETYLGKIKMIYIDPPYNTGKDFIYPDKFNTENWDEVSSEYDEDGYRMVQNLESNGQYHTDWLNIMYPRLRLAKDLLRDDGVIFISIDDNEVHNLRKICDEVFGAWNFVACLIWEKTRKNDARFFSVGHEYIIVYVKSESTLRESNTYWREDKPGAHEIFAEYQRLRIIYGDDFTTIEKDLKAFYSKLPKEHPSKKHARYNKVDENGVWRDDNLSWPGGGGPEYDVLHPATGLACKVPAGGWRFPTIQRMQEMISKGVVVFRQDHTEPPIRKSYLVRKAGRLSDEEESVGKQVMGTYFYRSAIQATKMLEELIGKRLFDYPKDTDIIQRLISYVTDKDSIILDFFSGSATTAHAVMQLNAEDGGNRKFIMVQIPEVIDEKHEAYKAGYRTICDIGKERIRRAGAKINAAIAGQNTQLKLGEAEKKPVDGGFRVLKVDSTNMKDVYYHPEQYEQGQLDMFTDNIKEDRSPEDLLFQVMLDLGVFLSCKIKAKTIGGKQVYVVYQGDIPYLIACFDSSINSEVVTAIAKMQPYYAVFRDSSMESDSLMTSFEQIFEAYSKTTIRRVL